MFVFSLISLCFFHGFMAYAGFNNFEETSEAAELFGGICVIAALVSQGLLVLRSYDWDTMFERHARFVVSLVALFGALLGGDGAAEEDSATALCLVFLIYGLHALFVFRFFTQETEASVLGYKTLCTGAALCILFVLASAGTPIAKEPTQLMILSNILMALGFCVAFGKEVLSHAATSMPLDEARVRSHQRRTSRRSGAKTSNVVHLH